MARIKTVQGTKEHKVVSRKQWLPARKRLLRQEKRLSKLRDQLNRQRRELPWVRVEKDYVFQTPKGRRTLSELFRGRSQLVVYHFMFGPGWGTGCPHCSFWADHFDNANHHLGARDTTLAVVSRAPLKELLPFKKRMGWRFDWVSSDGTDFNFDFDVSFTREQIRSGKPFYNYGTMPSIASEREGVSSFYKDKKGDIYHTYSSFARGIDLLNTTYNFLDLTAKGRDEHPDRPQHWVRYHDEYK